MNPGGDTLARQRRSPGSPCRPASTGRTTSGSNYSSDPSRLLSGAVNITIGALWIADERTVNVNLDRQAELPLPDDDRHQPDVV